MTSTSGRLNDSVGVTPHRVYGATVATAGLGALALGLWLGGGLPGSGSSSILSQSALTAWGLPISRFAVDVAAFGTMGMLITCVLLPRSERGLSAAAHRCLRSAAGLALTWAAATAALLLFSWSDVTGLPIAALPLDQIIGGPRSSPDAVPFLVCSALAVIISTAAGVTQTRKGAVVLLVLTGYNLLPLTTTGHAEHSPAMAYALTVHVVALALWIGGLAGLLIHVRGSPLLAVAASRFGMMALGCYVAVAASGITLAWVNLRSAGDLWGTRYGLLLFFKTAGLLGVGLCGWWHRRRTVAAVARRRGTRPFVRLAAGEVVIMAATVGFGVALSRSPTPGTGTGDAHSHAAVVHPAQPRLL